MDQQIKNLYISTIRDNCNGRKIVIYGAGDNLKNIVEIIKELTENYLIVDALKYGATNILNPNILKENRNNYYVVVSVIREISEIRNILETYGYKHKIDYYYRSFRLDQNFIKVNNSYCDFYGNKVIGDLNGAEVRFRGNDSTIIVGENFKCSNMKITVDSDVNIKIGNNVRIMNIVNSQSNDWVFSSCTSFELGDNNTWRDGGSSLHISGYGYLCIGNDNSFGENIKINVHSNQEIIIGDDNLVSWNIKIIADDGHALFDVETQKRINQNSSTYIGNHTWICCDSMICCANISDGCVIGAKSFVKGSFPNNCLIAGCPATIKRKNIAWYKYRDSCDINDIPEQYRKYTEIINSNE